MGSFAVASEEVGVHDKTLVASTVDTITFADQVRQVEVSSSGSAKLYFTVDGTAPTVGGNDTFEIPAAAGTKVVKMKGSVVKLISAGTPEYSVAKLRD